MIPNAEPTWLTYAEAARRVKSSTRTVKRWHRNGMVMEWRTDDTGQRFRVVELQVLLAWWRDRLQASPVHFYRMRAKAIERGETPPPIPARLKAGPKHATTRAQNAIQPVPRASQVPEGTDTVPHTSERASEWKPPAFHGHAEHAALVSAMEHEAPACDGLDEFTRDRYDVDDEQTDIMRGICWACPLLELCEAYAAAGKPTAGMWAGMTPAEIRLMSVPGATLAA